MKESSNIANIKKLFEDSYEKIHQKFVDHFADPIREEAVRRLNSPQRNLFHFIQLSTHEVCKDIQMNFGRKLKSIQLKEWLLIIRDLSDELQKFFQELYISFLYPPIDKIIYSLTTMCYFIFGEEQEGTKLNGKKELEKETEKIEVLSPKKKKSVRQGKKTKYCKANKLGGVSLYNENYRRKTEFHNIEFFNIQEKRNTIYNQIKNKEFLKKNSEKVQIDETKKEILKILEETAENKFQLFDVEMLHSSNELQNAGYGLKSVVQCYKQEKIQTLKTIQQFFKRGVKIIKQKAFELNKKIQQNEEIIEGNRKILKSRPIYIDTGMQSDKCKLNFQLQQTNKGLRKQVSKLEELNDHLNEKLKEKNVDLLNLQNNLLTSESVLEKLREKLMEKNKQIEDLILNQQKKQAKYNLKRNKIFMQELKTMTKGQLQKKFNQAKNIQTKNRLQTKMSQKQKQKNQQKESISEKNIDKKVHFELFRKQQHRTKTFFEENLFSSKRLTVRSEKLLPFSGSDEKRKRKKLHDSNKKISDESFDGQKNDGSGKKKKKETLISFNLGENVEIGKSSDKKKSIGNDKKSELLIAPQVKQEQRKNSLKLIQEQLSQKSKQKKKIFLIEHQYHYQFNKNKKQFHKSTQANLPEKFFKTSQEKIFSILKEKNVKKNESLKYINSKKNSNNQTPQSIDEISQRAFRENKTTHILAHKVRSLKKTQKLQNSLKNSISLQNHEDFVKENFEMKRNKLVEETKKEYEQKLERKIKQYHIKNKSSHQKVPLKMKINNENSVAFEPFNFSNEKQKNSNKKLRK